MSYINGTTHYNLPQTTGTDKRDWSDTNQAFQDIDAALYQATQDTAQAALDIDALEVRMDTAEQNIATNAGDISALDGRVTTVEGSVAQHTTQIADVRRDGEDMICAYNEATATSTHAYAVGDYFIYNDVLYRATASIGIGDTIVPDTNCTTTNVTTEILASAPVVVAAYEATTADTYASAMRALWGQMTPVDLTAEYELVFINSSGTFYYRCRYVEEGRIQFSQVASGGTGSEINIETWVFGPAPYYPFTNVVTINSTPAYTLTDLTNTNFSGNTTLKIVKLPS